MEAQRKCSLGVWEKLLSSLNVKPNACCLHLDFASQDVKVILARDDSSTDDGTNVNSTKLGNACLHDWQLVNVSYESDLLSQRDEKLYCLNRHTFEK